MVGPLASRTSPSAAGGYGGCAGGGTAWRDLTILLVERYCGADLARELAKAFVIDVRNDPQSVYAGLPAKTYHRDEQVQQVQAWLHEHFAEGTTLADLAETLERHAPGYILIADGDLAARATLVSAALVMYFTRNALAAMAAGVAAAMVVRHFLAV